MDSDGAHYSDPFCKDSGGAPKKVIRFVWIQVVLLINKDSFCMDSGGPLYK